MELGSLRAEADEAYAALTAPGAAVSRSLAGWVELVAELQETVNVLQAAQTAALAQVAAIEDVVLPDGTVVEQHRGLGHHRLDGPGLVAGRLGLSEQAAGQRMGCAISMVTRTPGLVGAMASGGLDRFRASVVCDELEDAPPDVAAEVVERLGGHLTGSPAGPLRRRVRRILGSVAPVVLACRAAATHERRGLSRSVEALGVDHWSGWYPVERSRSAWAAVDKLAQAYLRDGLAQHSGQARADAHLDLLLAQVTATVHLHATVPAAVLETEQTCDREWGSLPPQSSPPTPWSRPARTVPNDGQVVEAGGLGATGTSFVSRAWLTGAATIRDTQLVCHPGSGAALAGRVSDSGPGNEKMQAQAAVANKRRVQPASIAYRPPASMQALVRLRDGHCRFPGCTVSARFCDLDHVLPWPAGPTAPGNLMCLCRRHHRVKQRPRWSVRIDDDATVVWRDPTGRSSTTQPEDHLRQLPVGRAVERSKRTTDHSAAASGPSGAPLTTGADEWSVLDDVLLRTLLDAGIEGAPPRRSTSEHPRGDPPERRDLCLVDGWPLECALPPTSGDLPPF